MPLENRVDRGGNWKVKRLRREVKEMRDQKKVLCDTVGPSCFVPVIIIRYVAGGGTEKGKWARDFLRQTKQVKLEPRFVEMHSEKREEWRV